MQAPLTVGSASAVTQQEPFDMGHVIGDPLQIRKMPAALKCNDFRVRNLIGDGAEIRAPMREVAIAVNRKSRTSNAANGLLVTLKKALNHAREAEAASGAQGLARFGHEMALVLAAPGQGQIKPARRKEVGFDGHQCL